MVFNKPGIERANSTNVPGAPRAAAIRIIGCVVAACSLAGPLAAQVEPAARPFLFTAGVGMGVPAGNTRCLVSGYLVPGLEVRSRGRFFLMATAEALLAASPVEDCLPIPKTSAAADGGVIVTGDDRIDLEGVGIQLGLGVGATVPLGFATGDIRLGLGAARGQDAFRSSWWPAITAAIGASFLGDHLIVSLDRRWFHTPFPVERYDSLQDWIDAGSPAPTADDRKSSWKRFHVGTVGFRF